MDGNFSREDFTTLNDDSDSHTRKKSGLRVTTKSKKSFIPKRGTKAGSTGKFIEDSNASPEVKNAMKDIIRLLKGLDNISGGPEPTLPNDPEAVGPNSQDLSSQDGSAVASSGLTPPSRPVRVSHVILKHEDPKFTKVTFERFDEPEHTHVPSIPHQQGRTHSPSNPARKEIQRLGEAKLYKTDDYDYEDEVSHDPTSTAFSDKMSPVNNNNNRQDIKFQNQNSSFKTKMTDKTLTLGTSHKNKFVHFANHTPGQVHSPKTAAINTKAINKKTAKPRHVGINEMTKRRDNHFANKDITELLKLYKDSLGSDDEDTTNPVEEEKFYSYKQTGVFKEPSLSIFLPMDNSESGGKSEGSYWASRSTTRHETSLPENFGAPYFRLDGALLEEAHFPRMAPSVDIHKVVRTAVQEQQLMYQEATEAAKHLKKKLVKAETVYHGQSYSNKSKR